MLEGMKASVVVPSNRPERINSFLEAWRPLFDRVCFIVVEDGPEPTFSLPTEVQHLSWLDAWKTLGGDEWIIPRRTDCVRSLGYLTAHLQGAKVILTLDDDCLPVGDPVDWFNQHLSNLSDGERTFEESRWESTIHRVKPRGIPYGNTFTSDDRRVHPVMVSHGLWIGVPDVDAPTQLAQPNLSLSVEDIPNRIMTYGSFFPMCGMNLAWRREMSRIMYFLLMGPNWEFARFGDIWCGLIVKKICDHLDMLIWSGQPVVDHQRASNAFKNLQDESRGIAVNEWLWRVIDGIELTGDTVSDCYLEIANALPHRVPEYGDYWKKVGYAMHIWNEATV